jgi:hypothetical protein
LAFEAMVFNVASEVTFGSFEALRYAAATAVTSVLMLVGVTFPIRSHWSAIFESRVVSVGVNLAIACCELFSWKQNLADSPPGSEGLPVVFVVVVAVAPSAPDIEVVQSATSVRPVIAIRRVVESFIVGPYGEVGVGYLLAEETTVYGAVVVGVAGVGTS